MSDFATPGNLVTLGLCSLSAALWCLIGVRAALGHSPLAMQPREPCPWSSWAVGLAFPVSLLVQQIVIESAPVGDLSVERVQRGCLASVAEAAVLMGLLALGTTIRASDFGLNRRTAIADIAIGIGGFLAAWLPVWGVNLAVFLAGFREEDQVHPYFKILEASPGTATLGWMVLGAVILAPLVEELLFRVVIQGGLESRISPRAALLFVSIMFASIHSLDGRPDALPLFPMAFILGYIYYRRHSLLAVFTMHALFNATFLMLALMKRPAS